MLKIVTRVSALTAALAGLVLVSPAAEAAPITYSVTLTSANQPAGTGSFT
ncbi:MAG: hypothetical protein IT556_08165, partial [Acetobacteraceae bacterium]|nr:hypothetical protein [Acetobacteraceae bacterium]